MDLNSLLHLYQRRFSLAEAAMPDRHPLRDRDEIRAVAMRSAGIRDQWRPGINVQTVRTTHHHGLRIEHLRGTSWPGVYVAAHLYLPDAPGGPAQPLVLLACGHGQGSKLNDGYQRMARSIARAGACVLVPDNIGQGERHPMGHQASVVPFHCGTSIQGLIVMEALAWLDWARADIRFDSARMAAIGNSGGGLLTRYLAALDDGLAALASSGQPGTIAYTARKERTYCNCGLEPGLVGQLEMWQFYGSFAPRPMFLFNGREDHMFPWDLFWHAARQSAAVYAAAGRPDAFRAEAPAGGHSWDADRRALLTDWLTEVLHLGGRSRPCDDDASDLLNDTTGHCLSPYPGDAIDSDALAQRLSGVKAPTQLSLWDVYPPQVSLPPNAVIHRDGHAHDARQVLAQFEAFLAPLPSPNASTST